MRSFLSLSAVALTGTAAFMIPPNGDVGTDGTFSIAIPTDATPLETFGVDPYSQIVQLSCPGCPYAQFDEQGVSWTREQENYLVLNISVGASSKTLELSGVQIFPPVPPQAGEPEVLQVPADMTLEQLRMPQRKVVPAHSLRLSAWSLQAKEVHTSATSQEEVIDMHLRIHAIEQRPVQIPEVVITAVKDRKGDLLIIKATPSKKPYTAEDERKDCQTWPLLCKWKAVVADRLQSMRQKLHSGCHSRPALSFKGHGKKPQHHGRPHHLPHGKPDKTMHHGKPAHSKPHQPPHGADKTHHSKPHGHHHHHHHSGHHFMNKVAGVLLTIVIPLLVGILAGMVTYLVGMLLGTAIAFLWTRFRARRAQYAPIALAEDDEEQGDFEKEVIVCDGFEDAPPVYVREE